jgi:hypothetical protein
MGKTIKLYLAGIFLLVLIILLIERIFMIERISWFPIGWFYPESIDQ